MIVTAVPDPAMTVSVIGVTWRGREVYYALKRSEDRSSARKRKEDLLGI
jgi:hypothetical protein